MSDQTMQAVNTDRELYREPDKGNGSFYSDSIHVTLRGGIGINCGGTVFVRPLREWWKMAAAPKAYANVELSEENDRLIDENKKLRADLQAATEWADSLLPRFEDHYWDSLEANKNIVLAHVKSVLGLGQSPRTEET